MTATRVEIEKFDGKRDFALWKERFCLMEGKSQGFARLAKDS